MKSIIAAFLGLLISTISLYADEASGSLDNSVLMDSTPRAVINAVSNIDRHYTALYNQGRFNGNILIAVKGEPIYKKSFGYANKAKGERLTMESTFQLASTSKPFTAAAILILADQGKLKIDDPVTRFYPEFPYKGVTIRHLLCHRSGVPDYLNYGGSFGKKSYINNQDVVEMMISKRPKALASPNAVFKYNNSNYALLAAIVEKVSKESFADFCRENIFEPLGMKNTWVWHPSQPQRPGQTYGYNSSWTPRKPDMFDGVAGDKGVYSTVEDMLLWDQSWYNHTLLKHSTIEAAYEGQTRGSSGKDYGLGWRMEELSGDKKMIYHNGWWHDYNIVFKRFIHDSITVIIFSNKYNQSIYNTAVVENALFRNNYFEEKLDQILYADKVTVPDKKANTTEESNASQDVNLNPFNSPVVAEHVQAQPVAEKKAAAAPTYYTVKKGDTLFNISQRFNVTVEMLKKWNKMATANIQLGQRLLIDNLRMND